MGLVLIFSSSLDLRPEYYDKFFVLFLDHFGEGQIKLNQNHFLPRPFYFNMPSLSRVTSYAASLIDDANPISTSVIAPTEIPHEFPWNQTGAFRYLWLMA
jgi:hypothetical protein